MSTIMSLNSIENKSHVYRGKDFLRTFGESLRIYVMEIINFKNKKMKSLTNEHRVKIKKYIFVKKMWR